MQKTAGPLFEHACHEGNFGLYNTLVGARLEEKSAPPKRPALRKGAPCGCGLEPGYGQRRSPLCAALVSMPAAYPKPPPPPPRPPRAGGPNLNGIWQAMNTANWNIEAHSAGPSVRARSGRGGRGAGRARRRRGRRDALQARGARKKKENLANRLKLDPEIKCYLPGVPRATYMPFPFQIIQGTEAHDDGPRVRGCGPDDLHGGPDRGAGRQLDGLVERPLGRARRWSSIRRGSTISPGSTGRAIFTATRCTWWSASRRAAPIR